MNWYNRASRFGSAEHGRRPAGERRQPLRAVQKPASLGWLRANLFSERVQHASLTVVLVVAAGSILSTS